MRRLVVGEPGIAAIEVAIEDPVDPRWVFGRFRLLARGEVIGDWDDVVTLRAVVAWDTFATTAVERWNPRLAGLSSTQLFETLHASVYSDETQDAMEGAFADFHINHLGMSAFDPYVVLLVEPPESDQWLLWRREDRPDRVHSACLPARTLQSLGSEFVASMAGASPELA